MPSEFPQLAFTQWLSNAISRLGRVILPELAGGEEAFLSDAVDFADLKRRQQWLRRGQPLHHC